MKKTEVQSKVFINENHFFFERAERTVDKNKMATKILGQVGFPFSVTRVQDWTQSRKMDAENRRLVQSNQFMQLGSIKIFFFLLIVLHSPKKKHRN